MTIKRNNEMAPVGVRFDKPISERFISDVNIFDDFRELANLRAI